MPCGTWKKRSRSLMLPPSTPPPSEPIGTRDMLSTPPATTRSMAPDATPMAAKLMAWRPEPQKRLSDTPLISMGQPAASTALRAMLAPCSPACETQPTMTSSTSSSSRRRARGERAEHLREELLRVDAGERALAGLAAAARGACGVDDEAFHDGFDSPVSDRGLRRRGGPCRC